VLKVVINGKKYELKSGSVKNVVLALGDYKAKLVQDEHKTAYDSLQVYEFLFRSGGLRSGRPSPACGKLRTWQVKSPI
jgi:hypothetical protein